MSTFWSSLGGRGSSRKPPSGRSGSASRGKENDPPSTQTTKRPEDDLASEADPTTGDDTMQENEQEEGCLSVSRLAGQVWSRGGAGVLRVGLLPSFTRAGRTGSLPRAPPVPDSPKPQLKTFSRKRAASSSPTRDKRPSFRGISRDRLPHLPSMPQLPAMPHLPQVPHLPAMPKTPSLPPQLRNLLNRSRKKGAAEESPNKPSRRQGPVGRTWVKVYDDITYMDEEHEEQFYPILAYTGRPRSIPEAAPLPTPPTPPPPKSHQQQEPCHPQHVPLDPETSDQQATLDRAGDSALPSTTDGDVDDSREDVHERSRTPPRRQDSDQEVVPSSLTLVESEVSGVEQEDYIIPQLLHSPRPPPRGNKLYDNLLVTSSHDPQQQQETLPSPADPQQQEETLPSPADPQQQEETLPSPAQPAKPRRGLKVYEDILIRRQHMLTTQQDVPPDTSQEEVPPDTTQQEVPPDTSQEEVPPDTTQEEVPPDAIQEEVPPDTTQEEVPPDATQQEVPPDTTQEEVLPDAIQEGVPSDTIQQEVPPDTPQQEAAAGSCRSWGSQGSGEEQFPDEGPGRPPRRGHKVYQAHQPPSQVSHHDDTLQEDKVEGPSQEDLPERPSRGHKVYAALLIQHQPQGLGADMSLRPSHTPDTHTPPQQITPAADSLTMTEDPTHVEDMTTPAVEVPTHVEDMTTPAVEVPTHVEDITTPVEEIPTHVEDITTPVAEVPTHVEDITTPAVEVPTHVEDITTPAVEVPTHVEEITTPAVEVPTHAEDIMTPAVEVPTHVEDITTPAVEVPTHAEDITTPAVEVPTHAEGITTPAAEVPTNADEVRTMREEVLIMKEELNGTGETWSEDKDVEHTTSVSTQDARSEEVGQESTGNKQGQASVPPYAKVLKAGGTKELRSLATPEDKEVPPPIPPKKKGLRTISPQLVECDPPRPPRHLKPRERKFLPLVNGEVCPPRPARGTKVYAIVQVVQPAPPKRHSKVVSTEDMASQESEGPRKPCRRSLNPPQRRKKLKLERYDEEEHEEAEQTMRATLTVSTTQPAQVVLNSDLDNYENVVMKQVGRGRTRPLPPPPPPPKKGKIRHRHQQQVEQEKQHEQQQQEILTWCESRRESDMQCSQRNGDVLVDGSVGSSAREAGLHPTSLPLTLPTATPNRRRLDSLETDIDSNLRTIESSFAALDTVLKSLQTYSRGSVGVVAVRVGAEHSPSGTPASLPPSHATLHPQQGQEAGCRQEGQAPVHTDALDSDGVSVTSVQETQVKFSQGKTLYETAVKLEQIGSESERADTASGAAVTGQQQKTQCEEIALLDTTLKCDETKSDREDKSVGLREEDIECHSEELAVHEKTEDKYVKPKDEEDYELKVQVREEKVLYDSERTEEAQSDLVKVEAPPQETAKSLLKEPEVVKTFPETAVKFQEGKTVYETAVKIGHNEGDTEKIISTSETDLIPEVRTVRDEIKSDSRLVRETQQTNVLESETGKCSPHTLVKCKEGGSVSEGTEEVGGVELSQQEVKEFTKTSTQSDEGKDFSGKGGGVQLELEQVEVGQTRAVRTDTRDKEPAIIATVPQTSWKFEAGKTVYETAVKVGERECKEELESDKGKVKSECILGERTTETSLLTEKVTVPETVERVRVSESEKLKTVPDTVVKFHEGKTLYETVVKVGEEEGETLASGCSTLPTSTEAANLTGAVADEQATRPAQGKTVYQILYQVDAAAAIKDRRKSKRIEELGGESEEHSKKCEDQVEGPSVRVKSEVEERTLSVEDTKAGLLESGVSDTRAGQLESGVSDTRAGQLEAGVADIASRLQGIQCTLESVIINLPCVPHVQNPGLSTSSHVSPALTSPNTHTRTPNHHLPHINTSGLPHNGGSGGRRSLASILCSFRKSGPRSGDRKVTTQETGEKSRSRFYLQLDGTRRLSAENHSLTDCEAATTHHTEDDDVDCGGEGVAREEDSKEVQGRKWAEPRSCYTRNTKCGRIGVLVVPECVSQCNMYRERAAAAAMVASQDKKEDVVDCEEDIINTHIVPDSVTHQYMHVVAQLRQSRHLTSVRRLEQVRQDEHHGRQDCRYRPSSPHSNIHTPISHCSPTVGGGLRPGNGGTVGSESRPGSGGTVGDSRSGGEGTVGGELCPGSGGTVGGETCPGSGGTVKDESRSGSGGTVDDSCPGSRGTVGSESCPVSGGTVGDESHPGIGGTGGDESRPGSEGTVGGESCPGSGGTVGGESRLGSGSTVGGESCPGSGDTVGGESRPVSGGTVGGESHSVSGSTVGEPSPGNGGSVGDESRYGSGGTVGGVQNTVVHYSGSERQEWHGTGSLPLTEGNVLDQHQTLPTTEPCDASLLGLEARNTIVVGQSKGSCVVECCDAHGSMSDVLCNTNMSSDLTPATTPDLTTHDKRDRKIFLIAREVMTSERVFVNVLKLLNVDFRRFILEWSEEPALPEEHLNKILKYLPQLQNLNEEILKDLEERITDWERYRKISDVIVRKGPFLKLYSSYIQDYPTQCDHIDVCCNTYPNFSRVLKQFEALDECNKLKVKHYMLKPIQRIPQYRLLLEQYLKCLPHTHPDYMDTQTALRVVANVATHANNTMNQGNNFMKLLALHDRLNSSHSTSTGDHGNSNSRRPRYELVRPGRYLLKEGELLKLCRREMQPRYFILLSDVLLYTSFVTSGPGGALRLNCELTLEGMKVETPKAEDFKNEFSVISTSRSFTLQASTAEERDAWIKALREAIEDNASRRSTFLQAKMPIYQQPSTSTLGKQAPVWIPDYRVTMCQQCTAEFTLTFRRHHCRACGKVVCDHCSANRAPLQYKKNQVARVCDKCFEILQKDFENRYEGSVIQEDQQGSRMRRVPSLKAQFKKGIRDSNRYRTRKRAPERLMEVCASDTSSQMCGYLRMLVRRSWRKGWFVLKDRVLYEYRAPQDVCALQSLPVLGYHVQTMQEVRELADGVDICLAFQLTHPNQQPFVFHADSPHLAEKWIQAMKEAVILT